MTEVDWWSGGPPGAGPKAGRGPRPGGAPPPPRHQFRARVPKHFYVSPYSDVDVAFDFALCPPTQNLAVRIDDYVGADRTLTSTLAGPRRQLSDARLIGWLAKYPLLTVRVIALIHWHALLLWLKRIPWFAKSARAADQRGLFRPHRSIVSATPPL